MSRAVTVQFTTDLGANVSVSTTHDKVLEAQRYFGAMGWYSGAVPPGGLVLPFENERDFDWALLGGYRFPDKAAGETLVRCRGHVWKRRELEAQTKPFPMPAAIKYSRGAKPTDPPHLREAGNGDIEYVTLVVFRGGKRNDAYATKPSTPTSTRTHETRARGLGNTPIDTEDSMTFEEATR